MVLVGITNYASDLKTLLYNTLGRETLVQPIITFILIPIVYVYMYVLAKCKNYFSDYHKFDPTICLIVSSMFLYI